MSLLKDPCSCKVTWNPYFPDLLLCLTGKRGPQFQLWGAVSEENVGGEESRDSGEGKEVRMLPALGPPRAMLCPRGCGVDPSQTTESEAWV